MQNNNFKLKIPTHLAIIPDGNRRWAKAHSLPVYEGHRRGFQIISDLGKRSRELGIKIFTVWAFSTENWNRDKNEVSFLMSNFAEWIGKNLKTALEEQIRIIHLGKKDRLSNNLKKKIEEAEQKTKHFSKYYFVAALDYGGRDEILRCAKKFQAAEAKLQNLTEESFAKFLDTKDLPQPEPDLVIRTSGEIRTSGFMLWQTAYSEWIFSPKYLPDFKPQDLEECIKEYALRQRRYGI